MGRIGALLATCFEPAALFADLQEPIQQQRLLLALHQTHAKFGEDGEITSSIPQFQASGIFPINALTNRIGRLPIDR